jgi:outer membrane protein assembly factor BamB
LFNAAQNGKKRGHLRMIYFMKQKQPHTLKTCFFLNISFLALCVLSLGGCDDSDEVRITGKRMAIMSHTDDIHIQSKAHVIVGNAEHNTSWEQPDRNAQHVLGHVFANSSSHALQKIKIGDASFRHQRLIAQPIVVENIIYTMDTQLKVKAFDLKTLKMLWETKIAQKHPHEIIGNGGLSYGENKLFVSTGHGKLIAIHPQNGKILWSSSLSAPAHAAPTYSGGRLFINTLNSEISTFDSATGNLLWTHSGLSESASLLGHSSPSVFEDIVVTGFASGEIIALRSENGQMLWDENLGTPKRTEALSSISSIKASPVLYKNTAYVFSHSGRFMAIDIKTGKHLYEKALGSTETPVITENHIFLITLNHEVVCLNRQNGDINWTYSLKKKEDKKKYSWHGPILASKHLYLTSSTGELIFLDAEKGTLKGQMKLARSFYIAPIAAHGKIITLADDGYLNVVQ